jgi:hypothetical protein
MIGRNKPIEIDSIYYQEAIHLIQAHDRDYRGMKFSTINKCETPATLGTQEHCHTMPPVSVPNREFESPTPTSLFSFPAHNVLAMDG